MTEKLGRYEILEKIGEGGFAIVYRARDLELDRLVALKELRSLLLTDPTWVKRFRREAKAIARLDHPHIVTIYDVGQADGRQFIVMRLVDGTSLDEVIAARGRLLWPDTLEIAIATAEGLDYAHSQGILHRDLKPGNILVDSTRGPMLTDFGFAKLVGESSRSVTVSGDVVGTPHYIAPEAWEGAEATPQADIYALGCILYEMITGEKLFQGETPPAVMMAHFKPLVLPQTWPEDVPAEITGVLATALDREPTSRYASAGEIVQTLQTLRRNQSAASFSSTKDEDLETRAELWDPDRAISGAERPAFDEPKEDKPDEATAVAVQASAELSPDIQRGQADTAPGLATPPPQVVVIKEEKKRRGCLWIGLAFGVAFLFLLLIAIGGFCSTLNSTISNILPTVEVGEIIDEPIRIAIPDDVETIDLDIEFGSGELSIRPGAEELLVDGTAQYNVEQLKPRIVGENGDIRLRHENSLGLASFTTSNLKNEWMLRLADVPMALIIDVGAATGDIELGGLSLTDLRVNQGAASFELSFSEPNQVEMETLRFKTGGSTVNLSGLANAGAEEIIFDGGFGEFTLDFSGELRRDLEVAMNGGAGSFTLIMPEDVAAQVSVKGDSADVNVQGAWQVSGNRYILPGEGFRIIVDANIEGGSLRLRTR